MTFAMFLFGVCTLITGDFALTARRRASRAGATVVGLLFALSFPVNVLCAILLPPGPELPREIWEVGVHFGVGALFFAAALAVAYLTASPESNQGGHLGGFDPAVDPCRPGAGLVSPSGRPDDRIQRAHGFRDW
jgi:hypothetical protein